MFHHIITMGINGIMAIIALSKKVFDLGRPNDRFGANHVWITPQAPHSVDPIEAKWPVILGFEVKLDPGYPGI